MKVLWFVPVLMPEVCQAMGTAPDVAGGWMWAMLAELVDRVADVEFCVVCIHDTRVDIRRGRVRYVTISSGGRMSYSTIPDCVQNNARKVIDEFDPDIIHVHGTEFFYGSMSSATYRGKPVVVSLQGIMSQCWRHYAGGLTFRDLAAVSWQNPCVYLKGHGIFQEQRNWQKVRSRQEQAVFRSHKYFIGRTEWDQACLLYYNRKARYFHVDETLRKPFFVAVRKGENIKRHIIYCAGASAYPLKGGHWILRAIANLKDEFPDIQLRIAGAQKALSRPTSLAGRAHDQVYHAYMRRQIKKLGLEHNVVALPVLSAEEVADELRMAELYVSASLCENSPNSLCEAMLVGTPAIHTFVGGVPSILRDGVEGKLVPPYDQYALANAIREYFLHPDYAGRCACAARETAKRRHDPERNALEMLNVYRQVLALERRPDHE